MDNVPSIGYEQSNRETIVANYILDLVNIHDWIKATWTRASRGIDDLATAAYASFAARKLARQVLIQIDLEMEWQDPIFLKYARKVGLLSNTREFVFDGEQSTFLVVLLNKKRTRLRWHVYSRVDDYMHTPNFENSLGSDVLAQLERWLFCAAISGWDADEELTGNLDHCLVVALTTQMQVILQRGQDTNTKDGANPLGPTLKQIASFWDRLHSLKFPPDPWTLSHVIAQAVSAIHYQEMASSIDRLCAAVYGEKYRILTGDLPPTILQQDFGCLLPTGSLTTIPELDRAWKMQQKRPVKIQEKIDMMQWTWEVFEAKHIPAMFADLDSSHTYTGMLDKIRFRVGEINGRRLNIAALPSLPTPLKQIALRNLANKPLTGSLYSVANTTR